MRTYLLLLIILLTVAPAPPLFAAAQSSSEPAANYTKISSTTSLIIILLVSAILCSGFVSIYIRLCYDDTADGTNPRYTADGRPRRVSESGLDPKLIASFPIFKYSEIKHLKTGKGALSCAVCLREFDDNEMLRLLTKCDHVFHPECIDAWLASHFTCPICRANLSEGIESTQSTVDCNSSSEVRNQNQISITVDQNQRTETETRGRLRMLPRPHSTGHSLVQLGEDWERYTLRFPNGISRQVDMLDRVGMSDRWDFLTMTRPPPFFSRNSTKADVVDGEVTAVGTSGVLFLKSVKSPFDCLAGKSEHMSTDLPV